MNLHDIEKGELLSWSKFVKIMINCETFTLSLLFISLLFLAIPFDNNFDNNCQYTINLLYSCLWD